MKLRSEPKQKTERLLITDEWATNNRPMGPWAHDQRRNKQNRKRKEEKAQALCHLLHRMTWNTLTATSPDGDDEYLRTRSHPPRLQYQLFRSGLRFPHSPLSEILS